MTTTRKFAYSILAVFAMIVIAPYALVYIGGPILDATVFQGMEERQQLDRLHEIDREMGRYPRSDAEMKRWIAAEEHRMEVARLKRIADGK
jgi:hypothetical protein